MSIDDGLHTQAERPHQNIDEVPDPDVQQSIELREQ